MKKLFFSTFIILFLCFYANIFAQPQFEAMKVEAMREMQFGQYGEAIDLLNKYISAYPQRPDGYNLRGVCNEKREMFENAVYDYRSALKLAPYDKAISQNLTRATQLWYSLLYNQIEGYKREIAINPNKPDNYLQIGIAYKNLGQWDVAEEWYDRYLVRAHASPDEIIRYSEILAKNNHIAKGWPILKRYTEEYPNDQRIWSRFGYFSLWLGKTKIAIDAFQNSLALKPFFREAQSGLDQARGHGYIYTVNDTSIKHYNYGLPPVRPEFIYPIDKYYRILKKKPDDNETRLTLVKALFSANRFEEASQQIDILTSANYDSSEVAALSTQLDSIKTIAFNKKIDDFKSLLAKDSTNKKAVLGLGQYYINLGSYDSAEAVYENYLNRFPNDSEVLYGFAQSEAMNREFDRAAANMDTLISKDPNNLHYQLFRGQLAVWIGRDNDIAKKYLDNVLVKDPNNLAALIAISSLSMHTNDFTSAQNYMDRIKSINPNSSDLKELESDMYVQKLRYKQEQSFAILLEGERLYGENHCHQALTKYDEYLAQTEPNIVIEKEYADVNVCAGNYQKAIDIYTSILSKGYDINVDLARAKAYYYMGDTVNSLSSFQNLAKQQPYDFTTNLYLGDSYSRMHEYSKARDVFYNMQDSLKLDSTEALTVNQRIAWLPVTGFRAFLSNFPTYTLLTPYTSFYIDNSGVKENTQGLRLDFGVTQFLSVGAEAYRQSLANNSIILNANSFKWNIGLRLSQYVGFGVGFGNSYYGNQISQPLVNVYLRDDVPNIYSLYATYDRSDASQILYSQSLIYTRLNANLFRIGGAYQSKSGIKASLDFTYFSFAGNDNNTGNSLAFRIGKYFYPDFLLGYAYFSSGFAHTSTYYFSPQYYSSNNITADWDLVKDSTATVTIGGLIGFISNSNAVIRQGYAAATVKITDRLTIQGRIVGGGSYQYAAGYSSFIAYLTAYWSL